MSDKIRLVRVLVYEGDAARVHEALKHRGVKEQVEHGGVRITEGLAKWPRRWFSLLPAA